MNAYDLIRDALMLVGFAAFGEAPEAEAAQLAVRTLNNMLGEWSSKSIYNPRQFNGTVVASGQPSITLGPGGDISTNPTEITQVTLEMGTTVWTIGRRTLKEYERITVKQTPGIPSVVAWDRQDPVSTLYFWPVPYVGYTIRVIGFDSIPRLTVPQDDLDLPEIYSEAIVYGLAKRLLPFFPGLTDPNILPIIHGTAATALSGIKRLNNNMRSNRMVSDLGGGPGSSYWTWPGRVV